MAIDPEKNLESDLSVSMLSIEDVQRLAGLARIALTDEELELCRTQLSEVIDYNISLLSEVDVTDVVPTAQTTGLVNVWQADQPEVSLPVETVLQNAPAQKDNYFVVKKVLS